MILEELITYAWMGSGAVIAGGGGYMLLKKLLLKIALTDTGIESTEAQQSVIENLRVEVQRMSLGNKDLIISLQLFQRENMDLRREISSLHDKINILTESLNLLKLRSDDCVSCKYRIATKRRSTDELS